MFNCLYIQGEIDVLLSMTLHIFTPTYTLSTRQKSPLYPRSHRIKIEMKNYYNPKNLVKIKIFLCDVVGPCSFNSLHEWQSSFMYSVKKNRPREFKAKHKVKCVRCWSLRKNQKYIPWTLCPLFSVYFLSNALSPYDNNNDTFTSVISEGLGVKEDPACSC